MTLRERMKKYDMADENQRYVCINTKGILFAQHGERKYLQTLYSRSLQGQIRFWRIYVEENFTVKETGIIDDGTSQKAYKISASAPTHYKGMNVGRSNETTDSEQALFMAHTDWTNKVNKSGYTTLRFFKEDAQIDQKLLRYNLPMLAKELNLDKLSGVIVGASVKLDGCRCRARKTGAPGVVNDFLRNNGEALGIHLHSRGSKDFLWLDEIRVQLMYLFNQLPNPKNYITDGELYIHNAGFDAISGAVRTKSKPGPLDDRMEYWIFDLVDLDNEEEPYSERIRKLTTVMEKVNAQFKHPKLKLAGYTEIVKSMPAIQAAHDKMVADNYEGIIIRDLSGKYYFNNRVDVIQKYKNFVDAEFKVVDVIDGGGQEKGCALFVCESPPGSKSPTFNVRPKGTHELRKWQLKNKEIYIGKMLTVKYQPGDGSIPRFPVGLKFDSIVQKLEMKAFRDYE